ncbi:MAG: ferredoxin family protein [Kineosporiaceae bacterium]
MIEVVVADRCISCDLCIEVCPTNVFDRGPGGVPQLARHDACQTCYLCEAYCPTDALFVAPATTPLSPDHPLRDPATLVERDLLGSYRRSLGWGKGRTLTARDAVMPPLPHPAPPPVAAPRPSAPAG